MKLTRVIRTFVLLAVCLSAAGSASASDDFPYAGLARYRTAAGTRAYAPVLLRPAPMLSPTVSKDGQTAAIPCRAVVYLEGNVGTSLNALRAPREVVVFRVQRIQKPLDTQARFDADLKHAGGAPYVLILGLRSRTPDFPYAPATARQSFGLAEVLFFPPLEAVEAWMRGAAIYARLGQVRRLDPTLWREVRQMEIPELRFVALRDILFATYHRGFRKRPASERKKLLDQIQEAMGESFTPERWLRLLVAVDGPDRSQVVQEGLLNDAVRWRAAAGSSDDRVAAFAMGLAAQERMRSYTGHRTLSLLSAYLERPSSPTTSGLRAAARLAARGGGYGALRTDDSRRDLLAGIQRAYAAAVASREAAAAFWPLLHALVRELPSLRQAISEGETPEAAMLRDAVRQSLREPDPRADVQALGELLGLR